MGLSAPQKRALKNATPAARKHMLANFQWQASKQKTTRQKPLPQANPPKPRTQKQPRPVKPKSTVASIPKSVRMTDHPLNAFNTKHLPTTQREAAYLTTNLFEYLDIKTETFGQVIIVAPRSSYDAEVNTGPISDFIAFAYNENDKVNTQDSSLTTPLKYARHQLLNAPVMGLTTQFFSVRHRLHNLSVKVQCLGTDSAGYPPGDTWIGRVPYLETGTTSHAYNVGQTYKDAYVERAKTVGMIRSVSNKVLQNYPCTIHAIMNESVMFHEWKDLFVPSTVTNLNFMDVWPGLTPLLIYVPPRTGTSTVNIRINIAMQFCSRHPGDVVVRAAQKQYEPTSPGVWNAAVSSVEDAADAVAAFDVLRVAAAVA